jgi:hypothetical protein
VAECEPADDGGGGEWHAEYRPGGAEVPAPAPVSTIPPAPSPSAAPSPASSPAVTPSTTPAGRAPAASGPFEVAAPPGVSPVRPSVADAAAPVDAGREARIAALATPGPSVPLSSGTLWAFGLCTVALLALGVGLGTVPKRTARRR